jgi:hypothetical protein
MSAAVSEDSEESELMLKPARESCENVLEIGEYETKRKRSIYGPRELGKIVRLNVSGALKLAEQSELIDHKNIYLSKTTKGLILGMEYKTWSSTLAKFPDTLLGNAKTRKYFFHDE